MDPILSSGDTAWMLISTALVILMTIPGVLSFTVAHTPRKCVKYIVSIVHNLFHSKCTLVHLRIRYGLQYRYMGSYRGYK